MAYIPPTLGAAGLTVPPYADILADLLQQFQTIYPQNAYLATDSADYQWISALASKCADAMSCCQLAYNNRGPGSAIGAGLDGITKANGITRKSASASTASVTISGAPSTVINNGVVSDTNGFLWNLPASVTIGLGGSVMVTATCQTLGSITASAGSINAIAGAPTSGWTGVSASTQLSVGLPFELDSAYRARQAISVALPSRTMLAGTVAGIATLSGVTRYNVLENYFGFTASYGTLNTSGTAFTIVTGYPLDATNVGAAIIINGTSYTIATVTTGTTGTLSTSAGSLTGATFYVGDGTAFGPKNSISAVVEGGTSTAIAQAIFANRGIGCATNGSTTVSVTDAYTGATMPIRFSIPAYVPIYVSLNVHALTGYTSATTTAIQNAITTYLNSLQIGELVVLSELYGAALTARPNPDVPMFSIRALTLGTSASPSGTADVAIAYNAVALGASANVVITPV